MLRLARVKNAEVVYKTAVHKKICEQSAAFRKAQRPSYSARSRFNAFISVDHSVISVL